MLTSAVGAWFRKEAVTIVQVSEGQASDHSCGMFRRWQA